MKVLVLTRNLRGLAGAEIVAWEVSEWFAAAGDDVTIGTHGFGAPLALEPHPFTVIEPPTGFTLSDYDLVWSQHRLVTRLQGEFESSIRARRLPLIVEVSLAGHTPEEYVDALIARAIRSEVWANSPETAEFLTGVSRGLMPQVRVFHNAAPAAFWNAGVEDRPVEALRRLLIVSNHVPAEVRRAAGLLRKAGVEVTLIGASDDSRRITPEILAAHDAVLSIGKTASYAIAARRPFFVYDHFGGDGWLRQSNLDSNIRHNFSGRPAMRKLTAREIAQEIHDGFPAANAEVAAIAVRVQGFVLDDHLAALRERALTQNRRLRSYRAAVNFISRRLRVHLELARRVG